MPERRTERRQTPPPENNGRLMIQIIICATLICGFMFFKDVPIGGTTVQTVANHFINYTTDLRDTLSEFAETVIPASGKIESTEGN